MVASWEEKCRLTSLRTFWDENKVVYFDMCGVSVTLMWSFLQTHGIVHFKPDHLMICKMHLFFFFFNVKSYWEAIMKYSNLSLFSPLFFWFSCHPSEMRIDVLCSSLPCEIFVQKPFGKYKGSLWLHRMTHCQLNF